MSLLQRVIPFYFLNLSFGANMSILPSKQKLQEIRQAMETALEAVAKEHNIESIKFGSMSYDESGFKVGLTAQFQGAESKEVRALRLNAKSLGFKPEIAGAKINYGNKEYEIVGFGRSAFHLKDMNGKTYTAKVDLVRHALRMQNSDLLLPGLTYTPQF